MKKIIKKLLCFCIALSTVIPFHGELNTTKKPSSKIIQKAPKFKNEKFISKKKLIKSPLIKTSSFAKASENKPKTSKSKQVQLIIDPSEDYYYKATKENIIIKTKTYSRKTECIKLFGNNGKYLLTKRKKAIYPIKITIENNSDKTWIFNTKEAKLKTVYRRYVLKRLHHRTKLRAFIAGAAMLCGAMLIFTMTVPIIPILLFPELGIPEIICSILAYPSAELLAPIAGIVTPTGIGASATMAAATPFVSAARAESMEKTNNKITKIVNEMTKEKITIIKPGQKKEIFMFVRHRNYKKNIPITLINKNNKTENLIFDIACQPI